MPNSKSCMYHHRLPMLRALRVPMASFDKDTYEYEMTVGAIDSITIKGNAIVPEATVKVTRHSSLTNANKGTTVDTPLSATGSVTCYLKSNADTEIKITVTAPTGSVQGDEIKTKVYKLTVHKNGEAAHSLKSLTLAASASDGSGMKANTSYRNRVYDRGNTQPGSGSGRCGCTVQIRG